MSRLMACSAQTRAQLALRAESLICHRNFDRSKLIFWNRSPDMRSMHPPHWRQKTRTCCPGYIR